MRDRLIELIDIIIQPGQKTLGDIADYLLENGVVVLDKNNSVEDMIELLKAQIAVYEGWGLK